MSSRINTVFARAAEEPILLPPTGYGANRSITLMPVSKSVVEAALEQEERRGLMHVPLRRVDRAESIDGTAEAVDHAAKHLRRRERGYRRRCL